MLKNYLNYEVSITYVMGYSYSTKRGTITSVTPAFVTINNDTLINTKMIVKVVIRNIKEPKVVLLNQTDKLDK